MKLTEGMIYRGYKLKDINICFKCKKELILGKDKIFIHPLINSNIASPLCEDCDNIGKWECGYCSRYGRGYHVC